MSVIRINKTKDYTVMSNRHFREKEMSLKAKGLLSEMLSLPEDWDYSISGLVAINKENETSIKTALNELQEFGYLKRTKLMPNETESGRIEYIYDIYEESQKQEEEKQDIENLPLENQRQYSTDNKGSNINTCSSNKEKKEITDIFEDNLGRMLAPIEYEKIKEWEKDFDTELIEYALKIAVLNNKKSINYINAILRNWKTAGYKTKEDVINDINMRTKSNEHNIEIDDDLLNWDWFEE